MSVPLFKVNAHLLAFVSVQFHPIFDRPSLVSALTISNWLIANKLTLNMTKIEFMLIGSRQRLCTLTVPPRPSINGSPIEHVTTTKSLGVFIDDKLTWRSHIDKLTRKIAAFMESSFYFMILSKIVNAVYIVLSILGFEFSIVHMVFILQMNCTVLNED